MEVFLKRAVGAVSTRFWRVIGFSILLLLYIALSSCDSIVFAESPFPIPTPQTDSIKIKILNPGIKTAIVRVMGTGQTASLDQGILALSSCADNQYISVWAPGHYIKIIDCNGSPVFEYPVELEALDVTDNHDYNWVSANVCRNCHSDIQGRTENLEWNKDGHSRVFVDPYFWTMYTGTDTYRNPNGPGFRLDYPGENGNCAYCHAPAAVKALQHGMDLAIWNSNLPGSHINVETEGVTCDVCHKVKDVLLGNNLRPFVDHPGVLSFSFARPHSGQPLYIGPLADPKPDALQILDENAISTTCFPVFSESKFCAACHYGKFFDTLIYNSYGEWLESPYGQKNIVSGDGKVIKENPNYRSCQDCHMLYPEQIGQTLPNERDACSKSNLNFRDFNHNMMKYGPDPDNPSQEIPLLIRDAATLGINAIIEEGKIKVDVTVTNTRAGHKFPTDSPLRHLIMLVEARDGNDTPLAQVEGPVIPLWGAADYAGRAGVIYANILKDKQTNTVPTFDYWNLTESAWQDSDTRLIPEQEVPSEYSFAAPSNGSATITARLIYRYAFFDISRQKGWPLRDVPVTSAEAIVP